MAPTVGMKRTATQTITLPPPDVRFAVREAVHSTIASPPIEAPTRVTGPAPAVEGFLCLEEVELRGGWRCGEREGQGHRLLFFPPTQSITRKAKESDSPPPSFPTLPNSNPRLARVSSPPGPNPVLCCDCESKTREEMAPLSWRHHTLLQALLSRGPLPEPDFHSLFAQISGGKNPGCYSSPINSIPLIFLPVPQVFDVMRL